MSMELLGAHWNEIVTKVVKPLWVKEFQLMYKSKRLDYDDFESLAGYELSKAFVNFDETKSNVLTFATNVLKLKPKTELRNEGRDKRMVTSTALSLSDRVSEDSEKTFEDLINDVEGGNNNDYMELAEMLREMYKLLKPKERKILDLSCSGLDNESIAKELNLNTAYVVCVRNKIKSSSQFRRIGRRFGYFGGNDYEI